jgi:tryptophan synthase alpha chain
MIHVVVGYPSLERTKQLVCVMEKAGVDFVELQIPFSDPLADGPTIMKACEVSLEHGTRVKDAFRIAKQLSKEVEMPLLFMGYYNTIFKYGAKRFCRDSHLVGISGLIIPDMPIEEEEEEHLSKFAQQNDLHLIRVISPASTEKRLQKNGKAAGGFVYCAARQGITGAKKDLSLDLKNYLKKVRRDIKVPIAVGFGISSREHIKALKGHADVAVVGSALIDVVNSSKNTEQDVSHFIQELKSATL